MRWIAGIAVAAFLLGACVDVADPPEPTVLRVVMADDWAETAPVVETVRRFEREHPEVRIDVRGVPFSQIPDAVRTSIDSNEPIDLAHWHPFAAGAQGIAEPLDDLWEQHLTTDEFLPGAVADVVWGRSFYGVPLDTNALVLMANEDALREAGLSASDLGTFERLEAAAAALSDGERRAIAWPSSSWVAYGLIRANGGEVVSFDDEGDVTFSLDAPEVIAALDLMGRMVADDLAFPPSQRDTSRDAFTLFRTGVTALLTSGTWDLRGLPDDLEWEVVTATVPRGPAAAQPGTALGGSGLFVPLGSTHRDLAFEFMLALIDDDTALRLAREEGRLPARRRVFEDPFFDGAAMATVRQALDVAHPMRLIAFPEAQDAFSAALDDVLLGRRSAAVALADAQRIAVGSQRSPT